MFYCAMFSTVLYVGECSVTFASCEVNIYKCKKPRQSKERVREIER